MSTKLLRRILQQTAEGGGVGDATTKKSPKLRVANGKRKRKESAEEPTVGMEELLGYQVQALLSLDRKLNKKRAAKSKDLAVERLNKQSDREQKKRKMSKDIVVGNSRSSSSQIRLKPEPTFNKKMHKQEQEEKRLKEIAKILSRQSKKKRKTSAVATIGI